MESDPLDAVYSYVERAYIRLQAGEVLMRCLEEGTAAPIQQLVEGLVLAGPQSLVMLQEILAEAGERKTQVLDDLHQVFSELEKAFRKAGLDLIDIKDTKSIARIRQIDLHSLLLEQSAGETPTEADILQRLEDTREMMVGIAGQVQLLEEIEQFLHDWMWGLVYQTAHQPPDQAKRLWGSIL